MRHEKVFVSEDGQKNKVCVSLYITLNAFRYDVSLFTCQKGKRTWIHLDFDDYQYRSLTMDERQKYRYSEILKHVTPEQVLQTKVELWNKIKPA